MKQSYSTPKINLTALMTHDVITCSALWNGQEYPNGGNPYDGGVNANEQIGSDWWN